MKIMRQQLLELLGQVKSCQAVAFLPVILRETLSSIKLLSARALVLATCTPEIRAVSQGEGITFTQAIQHCLNKDNIYINRSRK